MPASDTVVTHSLPVCGGSGRDQRQGGCLQRWRTHEGLCPVASAPAALPPLAHLSMTRMAKVASAPNEAPGGLPLEPQSLASGATNATAKDAGTYIQKGAATTAQALPGSVLPQRQCLGASLTPLPNRWLCASSGARLTLAPVRAQVVSKSWATMPARLSSRISFLSFLPHNHCTRTYTPNQVCIVS